MVEVFEALSYVRRHTSNPQVLLICDTLSRLLQKGNTVADMSQVAVVRPIPAERECPVCAARKAKAPTQKPPQSKGKRTKAKKRKRQVGSSRPQAGNAPAASATADPVTVTPETSA